MCQQSGCTTSEAESAAFPRTSRCGRVVQSRREKEDRALEAQAQQLAATAKSLAESDVQKRLAFLEQQLRLSTEQQAASQKKLEELEVVARANVTAVPKTKKRTRKPSEKIHRSDQGAVLHACCIPFPMQCPLSAGRRGQTRYLAGGALTEEQTPAWMRFVKDCIAENAEYRKKDGATHMNQPWPAKKIIDKTFELHDHSVSVSTVERLTRGVTSVGKRQGHKTVLPLREEMRLATVPQMRQHGMRIHVHVDARVDMCVHMPTRMCIDTGMHICLGICVGMRIDIGVGMSARMCLGMCVCVWVWVCVWTCV